MTRAARIWTAGLFLGLCSITGARGAPPDGTDSALSLPIEIAKLNQSMTQVVALLRETIERQQIEVLLRRLELYHLDLAPLLEDLRTARSDKRTLEDELARLQVVRNDLEAQEEEANDPVLRAPGSDSASMKHDLETQIAFLKRRVASAGQQIGEIENELAAKRRPIELLGSEVDNRMRSWSH